MAHQKCVKPKDDIKNIYSNLHSNLSENVSLNKWVLGPGFDSKFDELKYEVIEKMDKEILDSSNTRLFIAQKYNELCTKIQYISELEATVSGFRSDVKAVDRQISDLTERINSIEKRVICKECPSLSSTLE